MSRCSEGEENHIRDSNDLMKLKKMKENFNTKPYDPLQVLQGKRKKWKFKELTLTPQ